jgi:serine/threonine protein kinase
MTDELIGKTLADKYIIEELLRESEFGNTYRGTHLMMESPVTIKILSPALAVDESIVERFSLEARTISRLSHPNILNVTDFGKDEAGLVFLVTEHTEGESLKDTIKREGAFQIERAVRITRQIAAALSSAHASRVIHQNLTSDKVSLIPMGNDTELIKVLDIGSFEVDDSRDFEDDRAFEALAYLSPEQCSQESEADERSDIYSLGIIFYEMLTGEVPFTADTATDLMMKHSQSPPPPLVAFRDDVPEEIEPILLNALAKNPDKRYQSASAFAEDLSEAIRDENEDDTIVIPKVNVAAVGAEDSNNMWKTAFIVLAGISLLAFGIIYQTSMKQTDPATIVQTDENGKPVQPLNPATGMSEQNLPNMDQFPSNSLTDLDPSLLPPDVGGEGGYNNPWDNSSVPPMGAPPAGQGGDMVTIPGDGSIFMPDPDGGGVILVPKPMPPDGTDKAKTDEAKTDKPADKPKTDDAKTDKPADKPKTDDAKTDKPADKPKVEKPKNDTPAKPAAQPPKKDPAQPSSKNRRIRSGVEQDT